MGRKPWNPQQTSAVVTNAGSNRTTARRRTAGRSAMIAVTIRTRRPAKSPSFTHPSMPASGSDMEPTFAETGVYRTNDTSTAGHPASIAAAAVTAVSARHDSGRPWPRRLPSADTATISATATCQ